MSNCPLAQKNDLTVGHDPWSGYVHRVGHIRPVDAGNTAPLSPAGRCAPRLHKFPGVGCPGATSERTA